MRCLNFTAPLSTAGALIHSADVLDDSHRAFEQTMSPNMIEDMAES